MIGTKDTAFALIAARRHTPSKLVGRENAAGAKRSIFRALTPSSSCWQNMTGKYWSDGSRVFRPAAIQRWRASSSLERRLRKRWPGSCGRKREIGREARRERGCVEV